MLPPLLNSTIQYPFLIILCSGYVLCCSDYLTCYDFARKYEGFVVAAAAGGWVGGQAEYVMVPFADFNLLPFANRDAAMEKIEGGVPRAWSFIALAFASTRLLF